MNDHLTYWILPNEQRIIDQLVKYQEIVAEYERINRQNREILEQLVKSQADVIAKHCEQIQLYDDYIHKIKKNNSIEKDSLLNNITTIDNIKLKHASKKKVQFTE